jgi:calcium-dependent protein kinase
MSSPDGKQMSVLRCKSLAVFDHDLLDDDVLDDDGDNENFEYDSDYFEVDSDEIETMIDPDLPEPQLPFQMAIEAPSINVNKHVSVRVVDDSSAKPPPPRTPPPPHVVEAARLRTAAQALAATGTTTTTTTTTTTPPATAAADVLLSNQVTFVQHNAMIAEENDTDNNIAADASADDDRSPTVQLDAEDVMDTMELESKTTMRYATTELLLQSECEETLPRDGNEEAVVTRNRAPTAPMTMPTNASSHVTRSEVDVTFKRIDTKPDLKRAQSIVSLPSGDIRLSRPGSTTVMHALTGTGFDKYEMVKTLNKGGYGVAHCVRDRKTGELRAMKCISKLRKKSKKPFEEQLNAYRKEVRTLATIDHPNVIGVIDIFETEDELQIVTELAEGGDLWDQIVRRHHSGQAYSEEWVRSIIHQVLLGVEHLHLSAIAHRDLKPDNIVLMRPDETEIKLIDFGFATTWNAYERQLFETVSGTLYYMAPEVLDRKSNIAADMWSIGAITYFMIFGRPPMYRSKKAFQGQKNADRRHRLYITKLIRKGFQNVIRQGNGAYFQPHVKISAQCRDFITRLLKTDVAERMTATEALNHPYIQTHQSPEALPANVVRGLLEFNAHLEFQDQVLEFMKKFVSYDEREALRRVFEQFDENHDQNIEIHEFEKVLLDQSWPSHSRSGQSRTLERGEIKSIFERADLDKNGYISFDELLKVSIYVKILGKEERMRDVFLKLRDANQELTGEVLAETLGIDLDTAAKLIHEADSDNDGIISYDEFLRIWRNSYALF